MFYTHEFQLLPRNGMSLTKSWQLPENGVQSRHLQAESWRGNERIFATLEFQPRHWLVRHHLGEHERHINNGTKAFVKHYSCDDGRLSSWPHCRHLEESDGFFGIPSTLACKVLTNWSLVQPPHDDVSLTIASCVAAFVLFFFRLLHRRHRFESCLAET